MPVATSSLGLPSHAVICLSPLGLSCRRESAADLSSLRSYHLTHRPGRTTHHSQGTVHGQSPEGPCRPTNVGPAINGLLLPPPHAHPTPNAKAAPLALYPQAVYLWGLNLVANSSKTLLLPHSTVTDADESNSHSALVQWVSQKK